ncbi:hypothetical protein BC938DRAFT_477657, partial [Jimgerdemannia flammicorona]
SINITPILFTLTIYHISSPAASHPPQPAQDIPQVAMHIACHVLPVLLRLLQRLGILINFGNLLYE